MLSENIKPQIYITCRQNTILTKIDDPMISAASLRVRSNLKTHMKLATCIYAFIFHIRTAAEVFSSTTATTVPPRISKTAFLTTNRTKWRCTNFVLQELSNLKSVKIYSLPTCLHRRVAESIDFNWRAHMHVILRESRPDSSRRLFFVIRNLL